MPQQSGARTVKTQLQMAEALELRAGGSTYGQIGAALGVSRSRAFKIVGKALDELTKRSEGSVERLRRLELVRLDRWTCALDPKKDDPRVVDTLIRLSERRCKLLGLDAPTRTELSGPDGRPIQTEAQEERLDFSKLSVPELLELESLHKKMTVPEDQNAGPVQ